MCVTCAVGDMSLPHLRVTCTMSDLSVTSLPVTTAPVNGVPGVPVPCRGLGSGVRSPPALQARPPAGIDLILAANKPGGFW